MIEHSPRPWSIGDRHTDAQVEIVDADGRAIAVVWDRTTSHTGKQVLGPCWRGSPQGIGNSKIIASSLAMYDILHRVTVLYERGSLPSDSLLEDIKNLVESIQQS